MLAVFLNVQAGCMDGRVQAMLNRYARAVLHTNLDLMGVIAPLMSSRRNPFSFAVH